MDSGLKIDAATPGLSLTPSKVTLASLYVDVIPVIILLLIILAFFVINVPDFLMNEDLLQCQFCLTLRLELILVALL